jgi:hypothetical protein
MQGILGDRSPEGLGIHLNVCLDGDAEHRGRAAVHVTRTGANLPLGVRQLHGQKQDIYLFI